MGAFRGLSLRTRIVSGVFAGLAVLFAVFGVLALYTINVSTGFALDERLRLAQISAQSVDELLARTGRQLEEAAVHLGGLATPEEQRVEATRVIDVLGEIDRIYAVTPGGDLVWSVATAGDQAAWTFKGDAATQAALAGLATSIVAPARVDATDDLLALVITPLDPGNRSAGYLATEIRGSQSDVRLLPLSDDEHSIHYVIVDAAAYIVAESGGETAESRDEHVEILLPLIGEHRSGTALHQVPDEEGHVVAFYPLQSIPGGVVVEQIQGDALVIPRAMQGTLLVYGVGALMAAVLAAWLHASSVVRPIRRLTEEAARMASGDLDSPIATARDDEIGQLARRFDDMRVKLKASLEESARWAEELEHRVDVRTQEVEATNRELQVLSRTRRQLLAKTITAQEEERKRLARDLHDDSAQTLTAVLMTMRAAEDALIADPKVASAALLRSRSQLEMALGEIRKAIVDLRPSALDDLGLASAIRSYADERLRPLGINPSLATTGDERRASGSVATAIFRIIQEAVSNVAQHSGAANARVSIEFGPTEILARVEDDGRGFDPAPLHQAQESGRGLGLLGMRERAALFGGDVEVESHPGTGTSVRVRIPLV